MKPLFATVVLILVSTDYLAEGSRLTFLSRRQSVSGSQKFGDCSLEETQNIFVDYPSQCYSAFNTFHDTNARDQTTYQEVFSTLCSVECTSQIVTFTEVCQAHQYADPILHACDRDLQSGDYCLALTYKNNGTRAARECYTAEATGRCSESCKAALDQLTTDLGCCVNTIFNTTTYGLEALGVASHKLWSICDTEPIHQCDNPVLAALSSAPKIHLSLMLISLLSLLPTILK